MVGKMMDVVREMMDIVGEVINMVEEMMDMVEEMMDMAGEYQEYLEFVKAHNQAGSAFMQYLIQLWSHGNICYEQEEQQ